MTLRGGYTGIISLETFYVNIFQTYATQRLRYCFNGKKIRNVSYKDLQCFFFFKNTSSVSHLNKFYLNKEKNVLSE